MQGPIFFSLLLTRDYITLIHWLLPNERPHSQKVPQEVKCHKAVMASVSKYFLNLLYGEYLESKQNRVELLDVPHDTFEVIVQYAYTGSIYVVSHSAGRISSKGVSILLNKFHFYPRGSNLSIEGSGQCDGHPQHGTPVFSSILPIYLA